VPQARDFYNWKAKQRTYGSRAEEEAYENQKPLQLGSIDLAAPASCQRNGSSPNSKLTGFNEPTADVLAPIEVMRGDFLGPRAVNNEIAVIRLPALDGGALY
jgi:hypothetical protein